jgi:peroxisomal 3,2-trans-enoyl-CoA isomerase
MATVKAAKDVLVQTSLNGVLTLRFNNPKKLNAWSAPMMKAMESAFSEAAADPATKAIVVTGTGNYYSAGVDLAGVLRPMAPKVCQLKCRSCA